MHDRRLAIESVIRLGPRQFVLGFDCPPIAAACRPGQFVMLSVADAIDPLLRRPMAVCRLLRDDAGEPRGFTIVIEVVGRGTALLEQKRPGDELDVLGPLGVPFEVPAATSSEGSHEAEQLLVMGGVGAAPFPFLAEEMLARGLPVRAFIGARTAEALLCADDLRDLGVPVEVATDDGTAGYHGFVVGPLERHLERHNRPAALYACGPTPMMRAVHEIAMARRLPLQVSFEAPMACGIGVCLSCVLPVYEDAGDPAGGAAAAASGAWRYARCCREGPVFDSRRLVWA
jgi:dihydroorotate dehydrogenase electron transfer subunit